VPFLAVSTMTSVLNKFKALDVYRDIPKDLTEQTFTGAIVSVTALVFIVYLFTAEFFAFLTPEVIPKIYVAPTLEKGNEHATIRINVNMTLPAVPCAVVSLDAQDVMGGHIVDVAGELHKIRRDRFGRPVLDEKGNPAAVEGQGVDITKQRGEGCSLSGYMVVKRVPGNFHVSAHAHANLLSIFFPDRPMNLSHIVHSLSFGEYSEDEFELLEEAAINPLKATYKYVEADLPEAKSYEYYIGIVPMVYTKLDGSVLNSFQYSANSNEILGRYAIPAIYFRYEFTPIVAHFTVKAKPFSHFIVQVCAIIGGVFTVLGIMNSMVNSTLKVMLKKASQNKLG